MKRLLLILLFLLIAAAAAILAGIALSSGGPSFGSPSVLVWRVEGTLAEEAPPPRLPLVRYDPPLSMAELFTALAAGRRDAGVRGLALYIESPRFGLAKAEEVRRQLLAASGAGKFVECYLETAGEGGNGTLAYYLATACDRIHLAPVGDLNLLGLYAQGLYLRGTLDKLKIVPELRAVGRYKSAVETYTRSDRSPAAEEAVTSVLDRSYRLLTRAIAERRALSVQEVERLIDGAPYTAREALEAGLVDQLGYPDEFRDHLAELAGDDASFENLRRYARRQRGGGRIAVVFARGTIVRGRGGVEPWTGEVFLGSQDLSATLRQLAEDDSIAAVVLRVDSPGGSALASDLILREVSRTAEVKPVVASFSDVAASGGYYIAAAAQTIVTEASTITGSIGVYGGKIVTGRFEEDLLGVTHDPIKRGANADIYSPLAPFTTEQEVRIQALLAEIYTSFVGHVSRGRGMEREAVEAVAQGRIWTGSHAVELGLADEVGGLDRALELAAAAAGLGPEAALSVEFYPPSAGWLDWLLEQGDPLFSARLGHLRRLLSGRSPGRLELPPELAALARPL